MSGCGSTGHRGPQDATNFIMEISALDHVVLIVSDVERSVRWYRETLGLPFENLDEWRAGTRPFASLRVNATTIIDLIAGESDGANVDHLALVTDRHGFERFVEEHAELIEMGPSDLSGARGQGDGVYLRDIDGHRIELRTYEPAGD